MAKPKGGVYAPAFQCRLTKDQHSFVEHREFETGASYAEIVRRLVDFGIKHEGTYYAAATKTTEPATVRASSASGATRRNKSPRGA